MTRIEEIKAAQRAPVPHDLPQAFKQLAAKTVAIDDLLSLVESAKGALGGWLCSDENCIAESCAAARSWLSKVEEAT